MTITTTANRGRTNPVLNGTSNLIELFERGCEHYGQSTAFSGMGRSLNYRELEQRSRQFAAYLQHKTGLKPGDRLAIQLPNLVDYPVVAWGALRAGLVLVNTNPLYTPRELLHQYSDSGARALVILAERFSTVEELLPKTDIETVICVPLFASANDDEPIEGTNHLSRVLQQGAQLSLQPIARQADDLALLQYTGGTTGLPKAAMLSHANLLASASLLWQSLDLLEAGEETFVAPLPLYHVYAFVGHIVVGMAFGVHSVLIPDPRNVDMLVTALQEVPFSFFIGINTLFVSLCQQESFRALDFSHLKYTLSGGMALSRSAAETWQRVTDCRVYEGYGLTESSAGVILNSPEHYQLGSIGKPMQGVEVQVVDEAGQTLAADEVGELCLRGQQIMLGYWQQPEASAQALSSEGWLHTGDMAVIQADGFIRIVDRKKDLIIVSGFNVYPNELEAVVDSYPGVLECAVIGCRDDKSGESIKLFVVANPALDTAGIGAKGLSEEGLRQHCRDNLAAYKQPKQIVFIDELPKSPVGKILRRELR